MKVPDIEELAGAHASNPFNRFVTTVSRCEHGIALGIIFGEHVTCLHRFWQRNACGSERESGQIDLLDQVVPDFASCDARSPDNERNMRAFIVQKLLAPRM